MKLSIFTALGVISTLLSSSALAADAAATPHHTNYFDSIDTNHDGTISKDEWLAHSTKMFSDIDANHDGKITHEEMKAYYAAKDAAHAQAKLAATPAK